GGDEVMKPLSRKGALALRLVGEEGRALDVSLGLLPFAELRGTIDAALRLLAAQPPNPGWGLAPLPDRTRRRFGVPVPGDRAADLLERFALLAEEVARLDRAAAQAAPGLEVESEIWAWTQTEEKLVADIDGLYRTQILPATFVQVVSRARDPATGRATEHRTRIG